MNPPPPPLRLTFQAIEDARQAREYYLDISDELAEDYIASLREALRKVRDYPQSHGFYDVEIRRCHLTRFPYLVIYEDMTEETVVYAVAHEKRNPAEIAKRIP